MDEEKKKTKCDANLYKLLGRKDRSLSDFRFLIVKKPFDKFKKIIVNSIVYFQTYDDLAQVLF
jgi:hypothetical protein